MSLSSRTLTALRRKPVLISIAVGVIVVVVWLLALFLPEGSKVSSLQVKEASLQQEISQGNAKVARLKHTFQQASQLDAMDAALQAAVPSTPDIFKTTANYTSSLSAAAAADQMVVTSVNPQGATAGTSGSAFTSIPVSLDVSGTYDHLLSLIGSIYTLPRLTDISSVKITGGGPGTNRTTSLKATLGLVAFTTAKPATTAS